MKLVQYNKRDLIHPTSKPKRVTHGASLVWSSNKRWSLIYGYRQPLTEATLFMPSIWDVHIGPAQGHIAN